MILVTGGAGYIGSHTCVQLMDAGYEVLIVDNFVNSKPEVLYNLEQITGKRPYFVKADICDEAAMEEIFSTLLRTVSSDIPRIESSGRICKKTVGILSQ